MTPPTGHLALVFTDVESSTALWVALGDGFREALERHDALLREAMVRFDGYEVKAMGDAFMVAFRAATPALEFCLAAQEALARELWVVSGAARAGTIRVRMGLHVGELVCLTTPGTAVRSCSRTRHRARGDRGGRAGPRGAGRRRGARRVLRQRRAGRGGGRREGTLG